MFVRTLMVAAAVIFCLSLSASAQQAENQINAETAMNEVVVSVTPTNEVSVPEMVMNAVSAPEAAANEEQIPQEEKAPEKTTEWVWGEVVSVDPVGKQVVVKHLDYESYEEVQLTLKVDDSTQFENVTDLTQIKQGDHITVDYKPKDGSNIADLIVVEKEAVAEGAAAMTPTETMGNETPWNQL